MKRKRNNEPALIQGISRAVIHKKLFELTFPDVVYGMDVEEEGEVEEERDSCEIELRNERYHRIEDLVNCLELLLVVLKERNVNLFIRIVSRCGITFCRSLLKETIVRVFMMFQ